MAQVNVSVNSDTKQDWEDYIEETGEYGTLSALVRTAVQREMQDNEQDQLPTELLNLATDVQDIKTTLEGIEDRLAWVEEDQPAESVTELAHDLLDVLQPLPEVPASSEADSTGKELAASNVIMQGVGPQTAEALAEKVGSTERRVETALTHLDEQFLLDEVVVDGETHYFVVK